MGGHAFKTTVPINQENIVSTISEAKKKLADWLEIDENMFKVMGSAERKKSGERAGDIDFAIERDLLMSDGVLSEKELYARVDGRIRPYVLEARDLSAFGVYSIVFPIVNDDRKQNGELVQVDLMLVASMEWARWAYATPLKSETKYPFLYRNDILGVIADSIPVVELKSDSKDIKICRKTVFDISTGLIEATETTTIFTEDGKKRISKALSDKRVIAGDGAGVVKLLFGAQFNPSEIISWESAFNALLSQEFKFKDSVEKIMMKLKIKVWSAYRKRQKDVLIDVDHLFEVWKRELF